LATGGSNKLLIEPASSSTSVSSYYCQDTSPTGGGSYISADGFEIYNPAIAAATSGVAFKVYANFDNASYGPHLIVADYMEIGIYILGACCSANFWGVTSAGGYGAGAVPLFITTNGGLNSDVQVNFFGGSFDHPGTGKNNVLVQGTGTTTPVMVAFHGTYMEGNSTDTSTPLVELQSVQNATFTGITACMLSSSSAQPAFEIDDSPAINPTINITGLSVPTNTPCKGSTKGIVDNVNSVSVAPDAANNISSYHTGVSSFAGSVQANQPLISIGGAAGLSGTGSCATLTSQNGANFAGSVKCTGVTGASTIVITPVSTLAPAHGFGCSGSDTITTANFLSQSGVSTTTCTLKGTVDANDVVTWFIWSY
jgi:hypothetical protein